jgi:hypothetical protein
LLGEGDGFIFRHDNPSLGFALSANEIALSASRDGLVRPNAGLDCQCVAAIYSDYGNIRQTE